MQAAAHSRVEGYTAIQLLIVMAIIGIAAAIGLPSFRALLDWQRGQTRVHLLTAHLAMARSLAVTQSVPISICPSANGTNCRTDRDWSQGWILFKDPDRAGQPRNTTSIMRTEHVPAKSGINITATLGRSLIRFLPSGRSSGTNITISLCSNARHLADVVVNNSGRSRTVRYTRVVSCPAR